jgi:hypothetical protein
MQELPRLDKKFLSVSALDDIEEEKRYWHGKGVQERLVAIEVTRRMVYGNDRTSSRLQRLLETSSNRSGGHPPYGSSQKKF